MYDFYSDTTTRPSAAMRRTMLDVEVGDEQRGLDPTTNALQERVADLLGKEAALFLPSGTMCNEIALRVHCQPGDAVICDATSHLIHAEGGGPAALSGVVLRDVPGERGVYTVEQMQAAIFPDTRYAPRTRVVAVEQTANVAGGTVWPVERLHAVAEAARARSLITHMDGARLMNAVVATGEPAAAHAAGYDSAWIDFSKGLGAPVGGVLAGDRDFIRAAWRFKQQWGGALRQSGVLAGACLFALDHNVERLAEDHALARRIALRLRGLPGIAGLNEVETNMVFVDLAPTAPDSKTVVAELAKREIAVSVFGPRRLRIVTHLDVDQRAADALCDALEQVLA